MNWRERRRIGGPGGIAIIVLLELALFFVAAFLISRLGIWPIRAINGFFKAALNSDWNYGFLLYKILLVGLVLLIFRRRLLPRILNRGSNLSALPYGLLFAGIGLAPACIGLLTGSLGLARLDPTAVFDIVLFQLINDSVEELTYRGYFLERANEAFPKRWDFGGFTVGPGVLVSGVFFGLAHLLNPFDPFAGRWGLAPIWGLTTLGSGLMFGLLREAFGSLIPPILFHALPDILGNFTTESGEGSMLFIAMMSIMYVAAFFLMGFFARRRKRQAVR